MATSTLANVHPGEVMNSLGNVGDYWSNDGWMVEVDFRLALRPLHPAQAIDLFRPLLPTRYLPIQQNGQGNQSCYLAAISDALGDLLLALTEG